MNTLKNIYQNHSSGKKVTILFVLTNIVYAIMLAFTIPKTMEFANGMDLLDMMPMGFGMDEVKALFAALGEEGRGFYLGNQIPVDMVYPFLFAISYSLLMFYLLKKVNKSDSFWFYLIFIPVIAGVADYAENFGIISMLKSFPDLSESLVRVTNLSAIVKSTSTTFYFVSLIVLLIAWGISSVRKVGMKA